MVDEPEDVGVAETVHELHLFQHVGPVTGHSVHLQRHDLPSNPVFHLERVREKGIGLRLPVTDRHFEVSIDVYCSWTRTHTHTIINIKERQSSDRPSGEKH